MAKQTNTGMGTLGFVLTFLGSLVFLYVAYNLLTAWSVSSVFAGAGAVLLPVFAGLGIVSAITLFFASFATLKGNKTGEMWGLSTEVVAAVTLLALTLGTGQAWYVVLGFVLAVLGSAVAMM